MTLAAILLAGGRASRLDGSVKPLLEVGGERLLDTAVSAAWSAGAASVTVVAPVLDPALDVRWVREEPPFAGPAAAVVAALAATPGDAEWTLLLACDLPAADTAVRMLSTERHRLPTESDGVCLTDTAGRPQWLTGIYRTGALRAAARAIDDEGRNRPVRALLSALAVTLMPAADAVVADIDTWQDLRRARERAAAASSPAPVPKEST